MTIYRLRTVLLKVVVALSLAAGTVVSVWQARSARQQAAIARRAADKAKAVQDFLVSVFSANTHLQADPAKARVCAALRELTAKRVSTFVIHGNRDFLLGRDFCQRTGCELLADPIIVELDAWHLPDTAATSYHAEHVKTSVAAEGIDRQGERLRYFHNRSLHELAGDDYRGVFGLGSRHTLGDHCVYSASGGRASAPSAVQRTTRCGRRRLMSANACAGSPKHTTS